MTERAGVCPALLVKLGCVPLWYSAQSLELKRERHR
jgi:hypothetical protein